MSFELKGTLFDSLIHSRCFYCGREPSNRQHTVKGGDFLYSGIDRKDSKVGYLPDNVVSCCFVCNDMKGTMGYEDFIEQLNRISQYQSQKRIEKTLKIYLDNHPEV